LYREELKLEMIVGRFALNIAKSLNHLIKFTMDKRLNSVFKKAEIEANTTY
jgi:hypothetical protein